MPVFYMSVNSFFIKTLFPVAAFLAVAGLTVVRAQGEPLSFAQALTLAQQSPGVTLAASQLELAQRQLDVASGVVSADLSAGYTRTWGEATDASGTARSLEGGGFDAATLKMTLNVVPLGPLADSVQRARWNVQKAAANLRDARNNASFNAAEQYLTALRLAQQLALDEATVALAQSRLDAAQTRLAAGAATDSGVLAAQIALGQAQSDLADTQRQQLDTLAKLAQTLGVAVVSVAGEPPALQHADLATTDATALETLLSQRSDVLAANLAVASAQLDKASTLRDYLPSGTLSTAFNARDGVQQLSAGASFDTRSFQPSISASYDPNLNRNASSATTPTGGSSSSFSLSVGLDIPLNSAVGPALAVADLAIAQSEQQARQTLQLARLEVDSARRAFAAVTAQVDMAKQLVAQAEQVARTTQDRYDLGLTGILDVQQAQVNLSSARLSADRASDARTVAALQLAQSLALDPTEVF